MVLTLPVWFGVSTAQAESIFDHDYTALTELLQRHVQDGLVRYRYLTKDRDALDDFLETVAEITPDSLVAFPKDQQLALLLNTYNACVLDLVLEHYPVASIQNIDQAFTRPRWRLAGREVSLDALHHEWIRAEFADARIHAALVCGARGCPPLRSEAYRAIELDTQLEDQCRRFAREERHNRLMPRARKVVASPILDWYGEDFIPKWGASEMISFDADSKERAVAGFLADYMDATFARILRRYQVTMVFSEFDWDLNEIR